MRYAEVDMTKLLDTEILSIRQTATMFISADDTYSLPKELHDALNNIFTKGCRSDDTVKFRKAIIIPKKKINEKTTHEIIRGRTASIYNALCLYAIIGTGATKKLFQHYYDIKQTQKTQNLDAYLKKRSDKELFFFGIKMNLFDEVKSILCSDEFDLFTKKLPSPFKHSKKYYDLTPLITLCDPNVNWGQFIDHYNNAEINFKHKAYIEAQEALLKIEDERLLNLPLVKILKCQIDAEIIQGKEAWDYLQKLLK